MSERRRILMLTTQLGYGGAETSFIRLANLLSESMEVTVALFTRDYGAGAYTAGHEPLNAPIVLLDAAAPCGRLQRWSRRITALRALKMQQDACISFLSGPNVVNALARGRAHAIVSLRGSRKYDPLAPRLQRLIFQYLLDPIAYARTTFIVPVSAGLANEIAASQRAKVRVIPPFVDRAALQHKLSERAPAPYHSLAGTKLIVAVGRLSVEKGFQHLIRVFDSLRVLHADAKLLVVGDGPLMATLRAQCATLALPVDDLTPGVASVLFAGYQTNVLPLMALGRVYAMTSATEGFPSVLLEAMAAGVPVVAADAPWGVRSILSAASATDDAPYPTAIPTMADYGMRMPRIDLPEHAAAWVATLSHYLQASPAPSPACAARVRDFDRSVIAAQWHALVGTP